MKMGEEFFMKYVWEHARKQSTCAKYQIGAALVKDGRIISTGYNGASSGFIECIEIEKILKAPRPDLEKLKRLKFDEIRDETLRALLSKYQEKKKVSFIDNLRIIFESIEKEKNVVHSRYEIHAEQNCLMYALRNGSTAQGADLYVSHLPCLECAKLIVAAGVSRVLYCEVYVDKRFEETSERFLKTNSVDVIQITFE